MTQIEQGARAGNVPARGRGPHLAEPLIVSRFWKGRLRDSAIYTELSTYKDRNVCDVRTYVMNAGRLVATPRGISISVLRLPELHKAVAKALKEARALGLLPADK
jgi:hypothetical protein